MGKIIDVESRLDLLNLVEELERAPEEQLLRWRGKVVAIIRPAGHAVEPGAADHNGDAAFYASVGSWNDHIDADEFIEDTYRQRLVSTRPPVDL